MDKFSKIEKALQTKRILKDPDCENKYAIFSDLHLGIGNSNDNSLKNANFTFEALKYYLENDYHVILNGDTFELAENRDIELIKRVHENIMWVLSELHKKGLLTIVKGNHDSNLTPDMLRYRKSSYTKKEEIFIDDTYIYDSAVIYSDLTYIIMHGHQVLWQYQPFLNGFINFIIRNIWAPFEKFLLKDPTSELDGFEDYTTVDKPFSDYATEHNCIAICGHTHSVQLSKPHYYNIGGGTLPRCITVGEIVEGKYQAYKWSYVVDHQVVLIKKSPLD